jgi:hypothetical protein
MGRTAVEGQLQYWSDESPRKRESDTKKESEKTPRSSAGYAPPSYVSPYAALPWAHEQAYHEILSKLEVEKGINDSRQASFSKAYDNAVAHLKRQKGASAPPSSLTGRLRQQSSEDSPYRNIIKPQQQAGRLSALRQRSRESLSPSKGSFEQKSRESLSTPNMHRSTRSRRKVQAKTSLLCLQAPVERTFASKHRVHLHFHESLLSQPLAAAAEDATADGRVQKADRRSEKTSKRTTSGQSSRLGQEPINSGDLDPGCDAIHAEPASREALAAKHPKAEAKGKMAYWPEWQQELTKGALRVYELDQQLAAMRSSNHSMQKMAGTRMRMPSLVSSLERTPSSNVRGTTAKSDRKRNALEDRPSLVTPSANLSAYQARHVPLDRRQGRAKKAGKGEADGQTPDTLFPTFKAPFWPLQANVLGSNELNRRSPSLPPSPLSLLPLSSPSSAEGQRGREGRRGRERGRNQREKRGEKERERGQRARAGSVDATNLPSFTKLPSFAVLYGEVARPRKLAWREAAKVRSDAECHNPKP